MTLNVNASHEPLICFRCRHPLRCFRCVAKSTISSGRWSISLPFFSFTLTLDNRPSERTHWHKKILKNWLRAAFQQERLEKLTKQKILANGLKAKLNFRRSQQFLVNRIYQTLKLFIGALKIVWVRHWRVVVSSCYITAQDSSMFDANFTMNLVSKIIAIFESVNGCSSCGQAFGDRQQEQTNFEHIFSIVEIRQAGLTVSDRKPKWNSNERNIQKTCCDSIITKRVFYDENVFRLRLFACW